MKDRCRLAFILICALPMVRATAAETPVPGESTAPIAPAPLDPVFDCYSANSAWGLAYSGKVIDRSGRIWSYRRRDRMLPVRTRENDRTSYAAAELQEKFDNAKPLGQVDAPTLADHLALLEQAGAGSVTASDTGVRDAGTSTCHGYVIDAQRARYRDIELGSDGGAADQRIVNDAAQAATLIDWLRSIGVAR